MGGRLQRPAHPVPQQGPQVGGRRRGELIGQTRAVDAFRRTNAAFHAFLIGSTGNSALRDAYNRLTISEYMAEALRPRLAASQKITLDHLDLVSAFERGDLSAAQLILTEHTERSKETMRAGIAQAGSGP
jgi:benzoate/toluate 1,2-dioxygenase reductase subunit